MPSTRLNMRRHNGFVFGATLVVATVAAAFGADRGELSDEWLQSAFRSYCRGAIVHTAAALGDVPALAQLLGDGADANGRLDETTAWPGATPLHLAAIRGRAKAVAALLRSGADPNLADDRGVTPLMVAAGAVPIVGGAPADVVAALLAAEADPNREDLKGRTAIHHACGLGSLGNSAFAQPLAPAFRPPSALDRIRPGIGGSIGAGYDVPSRVVHAFAGDAVRLELLLRAGADACLGENGGREALLQAPGATDDERFAMLLSAWRRCAPDGSFDRALGEALLRATLSNGTASMVALAIEAGADPTTVSFDPIGVAVWATEDAGAKTQFLLDRFPGLPIDVPGGCGDQPPIVVSLRWRLVASCGQGAMIPLLRAGADPLALDNNGRSLVIRAAEWGSAEELAAALELIPFDPNPEKPSEADAPLALVLAARSPCDAAEKIQMLADRGVLLEAVDERGRTALLAAAEVGNWDAVATLVERGADLTRVIEADRPEPADRGLWPADWEIAGMTALHLAAWRGGDTIFLAPESAERAVEALLKHAVPIDAQARSGATALLLAIDAEQESVARMLLAAGARCDAERREPDLLDDDGVTVAIPGAVDTPLSLAVERLSGVLVPAVLAAGAPANDPADPLSRAAGMLLPELVATLVDAGADVNANGGTPLQSALNPNTIWEPDGGPVAARQVAARQLAVVGLLLAAGADPEVRNWEGRTAFLQAVSKASYGDASPRLVEMLLEAGASPHATDDAGDTALDVVRRAAAAGRETGEVERIVKAAMRDPSG
ncbi:MAG: ankyrin repeat domain-containing protein [Phycisphaerales bacterium]|nr:ankyrin repeat domain-containing protein [Phycisphaerales bacterium]